MNYNDEFLKKMVQCGTLGYPISKILNVCDVPDVEQFIRDFDNPNSIIAFNYQKGSDISDFLLDGKLYEMAKNGDLQAMKKYEERKKANIAKGIAEARERNLRTPINRKQLNK